jgi:negative regulator of genetic competence, sporulation and motility
LEVDILKNKMVYVVIIIFSCLLSFFGFYLLGKGFNVIFFNKPHTQTVASNDNNNADIQTSVQNRDSNSNINSQQKVYNTGTKSSEDSKTITEETNKNAVNESQTSNVKNSKNLLYKVRLGPFDDEQDSVGTKKELFKLGYSSILLKANGAYWLQLAALNNKEDALNLVNNLKLKGINAKIISEQ